ncbi:hypothetical protein FA09DRAFT_23348 [Tilletiopsis washingtonensis]|uniref:Uncharacterized protein n=1 Tax=Tilletiopsis washingtonensis TaxID=58919 RepID=A0A316ZBF6_9BASI|nr:hypothetical protein FA09DRAFT_23348 [Tilletiopsis washingtonensis]PWN98262.1 hypothetical protein FA09DRAFT_23348 [Tilletiopsis washingtonensis]
MSHARVHHFRLKLRWSSCFVLAKRSSGLGVEELSLPSCALARQAEVGQTPSVRGPREAWRSSPGRRRSLPLHKRGGAQKAKQSVQRQRSSARPGRQGSRCLLLGVQSRSTMGAAPGTSNTHSAATTREKGMRILIRR